MSRLSFQFLLLLSVAFSLIVNARDTAAGVSPTPTITAPPPIVYHAPSSASVPSAEPTFRGTPTYQPTFEPTHEGTPTYMPTFDNFIAPTSTPTTYYEKGWSADTTAAVTVGAFIGGVSVIMAGYCAYTRGFFDPDPNGPIMPSSVEHNAPSRGNEGESKPLLGQDKV